MGHKLAEDQSTVKSKSAILAEGPLEDMRRLQRELEQLTAEIAAVSPAAA
jgi:hypothetical protein